MSINPFRNLFAKNSEDLSYEKLWEQVEKDQKDDLPQQVLKDASAIYDKADKEKDFAQLLKSWIVIVETRSNIDPDSFRIDALKPLPHQGAVQTAIYNAIMASAYLEMCNTSISDNDAETQEEYDAKARELFAASLSDREALYAESALDYLPLIDEGKDSRLYNHDLLSVLTRFALEHSRMSTEERIALTEELAAFYQEKGNLEASTLLKTENLKYRRNVEDYNIRLTREAYMTALKQLLEESAPLEAYAEVAYAYVEQLSGDESVDFCRETLENHPKLYNINYFRGTLQNQLRPELRMSQPGEILANKPFTINLRYENITDAKFTVRKFNGYKDKYEHSPRLDGAVLTTRDYTLADDSLNTARREKGYSTRGEKQDELTLAPGRYVFIAEAADQQDCSVVNISSMRLLFFRLPEDKILAVVRDNETGRPVPNAVVKIRDYNKKHVNEYPCDQNGEVMIDNDKDHDYVQAYIPGTDDYTPETGTSRMYSPGTEKAETKVKLYTDRSIYRPGQTVHVAGIAYLQNHDETTVVRDQTLTLTLFDANNRKIADQQVTTGALGSFDTDFVLPQGILPGTFRINSRSTNANFRVEEYKRPTFRVEARNTATEGSTFTFGDTIQVEALAKTYAGVPVQGATARYKVETAEVEFWRWWETDWTCLAQDVCETDDEGIARIPVFLDPHHLEEWSSSIVRYRVTFDVTDLAGETRSDSYEFSLSRRTFALQIAAPGVIDVSNDKHQVKIDAINANHEPVSCTGTYRIYKRRTNALLYTGTFQSGESVTLPTLASGDYYISAFALDRDGTEVVTEDHCFSLIDTRKSIDAAAFSEDFIYLSKPTFSEEQEGEIFISPSEGDVSLEYIIHSNDHVVERKQMTLNKQITRLRIPYRKEYGDGVSIQIYYVRNGHVMQERRTISYAEPNKKLKLAWSTFRDRLLPGQSEEWTLTISDPQGNPVSGAELLATMYDASLEALQPHSWPFAINFRRDILRYPALSTHRNTFSDLSIYGQWGYTTFQNREFDELTQYIHERWLRRYGGRNMKRLMTGATSSPLHSRSMAKMDMMASLEDDAVLNEVVILSDDKEMAVAEEAPQQQEEPQLTLRSNFAETAFFEPHLLSDSEGRVRISFTLPETLTEWRFMGLAHDSLVNYGQINATVIAQKDFMVQPNMPRFVRVGDHATISARIINQGEDNIAGKVRIRLLDAETEQVVYTDELPMTVDAGKTASVTFSFEASDAHPMLICEIVGMAGDTSDGERNFLPVLTSSKYITETVPFYIMAEDSVKQIDIHGLFNNGSPTATQKRLVFEFTQHPEWTVIEALDGIKLPEHDNAPCFAASLFANTVASRLAQSITGLHEALLEAQEAGITAKSQLDLNEDLREILQKESPWVMDAINEAEQRNRLIDLFDDAKISTRTTKAKERLKKLQNSDGSWSWFEGMAGSYYITLSTCENLIGLCDTDADINKMVTRALKFLDEKEYEDYEKLKKDKQPVWVGEGTIHYLYVCAMMPERQVSKHVQKMRKEMLKVLAGSVRNLTILGRSQAACVLRNFGYTKEADKFLQSVVEYSVSKPGMGRYYATDNAYYSWRDYRIPTQLAAMRAIKASKRPDKQDLLNEMQIWLLRQKQTQTWDNPFNTIGAVTFMLENEVQRGQEVQVGQSGQAESLQAGLPSFRIDAHPLPVQIDSTRFLAKQLGYVRTPLDSTMTNGVLTQLTIEQTTPEEQTATISWGALYAQYLEQMDRLSNQTSGELRIEVKLLDAAGKTIDPTTATLRVGDQVTMRLIVTADRDMDFVQIRCQRPACFEPKEQRSGYCWMNGRGGYIALHDASTDVFFDRFRRGKSTLDLKFSVDRAGEYLSGIATAQCAYATEFCAHSSAMKIQVVDQKQ